MRDTDEITGTAAVFATAAKERRGVLVGYLPAGFPSVPGAIEAARAMVSAGVDVVEVGLPYSDPVIDGPVIQDAVHRALAGGTRVADVLRTVEAVAGAGATAQVMTYWNPVVRYGVERFAADLAAAGGAGLITPDLPPEEAGDWSAASQAHHLDRVFLVAPSSTDARIAAITAACRGFVYAASVMGVTGARARVSAAAEGLVGRVRAASDIPVVVGLGVRDGDQAATVASYADGVAVGSAFVERLLAAGTDTGAGVRDAAALAAELAGGVRRRGAIR